MDRMRWFAVAEDLDSALSVWREWRASKKRPCTESYNIIKKLCALTGKDSEAVDTFRRMIDERALPDSRTYTVMIEHLVNSGKLDPAIEIFKVFLSMRMKHTLRQYSILVGALCGADQFDVAKTLLTEMQIEGILPTPPMLRSLQQMNDAGFVEETSDLIKELLPDKRIKNVELLMEDKEHHDDDGAEDSDANVAQVKLKPWFDPAILARALHDWRPHEVSELEDAEFIWTTRLVSRMIRNFSSAETAWKFFCWVENQPGFTHDIYTVSSMISKSARKGTFDLVDQIVSKAHREGLRLSFNTIRLVIDFYGISGYVTRTRLRGSDTGADPSVGSSKIIKCYIKFSVKQPHPYPHPHPCRVVSDTGTLAKVKGPCNIDFRKRLHCFEDFLRHQNTLQYNFKELYVASVFISLANIGQV